MLMFAPDETALRNEMPIFSGTVPRSSAALKPWPVMDRSTERPGFMLTPERLWIAYRQADAGAPATQCGIFEDMVEVDGHTRGQVESRIKSVAEVDIDIIAGGDAAIDVACAEALREDLGRTNLEDAIWHVMESIFFGYAGQQVLWDLVDGGRIAPIWFLLVEHRRFCFDEANYPRIRTEDNPWPGVPLKGPAGQWWFSHRRHRLIQRAGLMRTVGWWLLFKRLSVRDWMIFAEKFGLPIVLGQHKELASDETRRALKQALVDIGTDGQAMLSDAAQIVIKDASMRGGDISSLHPAVIALCNAEISKLITGGTLSVETGGPGSFALGKVHENRSVNLNFRDAKYVQRQFRRAVSMPYVLHNPRFKGAKPPLLHCHVQPEVSPEVDILIDEKLQVMGFQHDPDDLARRYGRRRAAEGKGLVRPEHAIAERDSETKRKIAEKPEPKPSAAPPRR